MFSQPAVRVGAPLESGTAPRRSVEGRTGLRLRRLQLAAIALLFIVSGIPARAQNRQCFQCMAVEGCAHFRQNPRYPPAATGPFAPDSPQCQRASEKCGGACCPMHGVLRPFIETFNEAVDRVPGLSDALQNGEAITGRIAEDLRNDYDLTRSGAGLRLIRDALLAEAGEGLFKPTLTAPEKQLGALVTKEVPAVERQLGTLVAESERVEHEAIAQCIGRLSRLTDPARISGLVDQMRGANSRINKIMYWLYQSEDAGANPERVLAAALSAAGYLGGEAQLTLKNLLSNYQAAKTVGAFTEENLARLRLGKSALLSNGVKLDIDHIIPVAISRELGTNLANLRLTAASVNRIAQEAVTSRALEYAEELNKAALLSSQGLDAVRQAFMRGGAHR